MSWELLPSAGSVAATDIGARMFPPYVEHTDHTPNSARFQAVSMEWRRRLWA